MCQMQNNCHKLINVYIPVKKQFQLSVVVVQNNNSITEVMVTGGPISAKTGSVKILCCYREHACTTGKYIAYPAPTSLQCCDINLANIQF